MSVASRVSPRDRTVAFVVLTAVMLAIAAGHFYLIGAFTAVYLGLPLWLWLQLGVVAILLALAWVATDAISPSGAR